MLTTETELTEKELYIRYGSAASEAMFDFPCYFFRLPDCQGFIPYRIEHRCAIVFGDPICPPEETAKLTRGFHAFCTDAKLNLIYLIVSEKFVRSVMHRCPVVLEVCEEYIFDPKRDPCKLSKRLRHRVEKAKKHGLTVHEYVSYDPRIEQALKEVGLKWQQGIKGSQIYLGHLDFFENREGKRWFYVKDGGRITSMVLLCRIETSNGWLLKFLITEPGAFHETSEFLMTSVLEILREENCRFLTKGVVPADSIKETKGVGLISSVVLKSIYHFIKWLFNFKKRKEYWLRYNPSVEPAFIATTSPRLGFKELRALMRVLRTSHSKD